MWRLPNERPTSWPTMIPPRAGEITVSQSNWRTLSASHPHTFAAMSVYSRSSAHWKYSRLCRPERKTKWPSSSAPVFLNSASRSSLGERTPLACCFRWPAENLSAWHEACEGGEEIIARRIHEEPFDEPSNGARQRRALPRSGILPRCIIGGLVGFGCGGNYLDFHIGSLRQRGNLDGGPCRRILFEIRAVYLIYRLKIAEAR